MRPQTKLALGALAGLVALLLFYQTPLMRYARGVTWGFVVSWVGRFGHVGALTVPNDVMEQLKTLQSENASLRGQLQDYNHLRSQLVTPTIGSLRSIPAAVVGRPVDTFRSQFILSRGISDGVTVGQAVMIRGTTLIGFIVDVSQHSSVVQLLLHPQTNITAEIVPDDDGGTAARGLLQGKHYTSLYVSTIPRDITIKVGQAVVTVANGQIPHGLFVGTVGTVTAKENEPYQTVDIQLPYDVDSIDAVHILAAP